MLLHADDVSLGSLDVALEGTPAGSVGGFHCKRVVVGAFLAAAAGPRSIDPGSGIDKPVSGVGVTSFMPLSPSVVT